MDRVQVFAGSIPLDTDSLKAQQNAMVAVGYALQAAYGANTVFIGLNCQPTAPASMQVQVGPGAIVQAAVIETTPFGSLPADTSDPLVKMGINVTSTLFTLTAPTTAGTSQNYMIQGAFSEADDSPATLTYFNSLNPNQPFSGPANSGTPQNTRRAQRCNLLLKVGVPANTGTQVTPPVDAGWSGLYVITVSNGQTAITSSSISTYPNSPFLAAFLNSHHGGVPGQAPKINLATEVQGVLNAANLPSAVGSTFVWAGNPNTHVAGSASSGATPPTLCWDSVNDEWWTCITSGTAATAVWAASQNSKSNQVFSASGTFTVPVGVTRIKARVVGGGGGGGGTGSQGTGGGGGGGGGYAEGIFTVTPGASIAITIGSGGGGTSSAGSAGGTSSFGSFCSATGGAGGLPYATTPAGGGGGAGSGGQVNLHGCDGGDGSDTATAGNPYGGHGGASGLGGGAGRAGSGGGSNATSFGGGGGGAYTLVAGAYSGANGFGGVVILEW